MKTSQDPNATLAYDLVSAPEVPPADNLAGETPSDESTENTQATGHSLTQKEKVKLGGIAAAAGAVAGIAGTVAATTYGAGALHSIQEAGTDALNSVENFLGLSHDTPAPAPGPAPANGPAPDQHAPASPAHHQADVAAHHPAAAPTEQAHDPAPQPTPDASHDSNLVDLNNDGTPDAVIVDDHGNPEMIVDMDHDGVVDSIVVDADHDGQLETGFIDTDHDGYADQQLIDVNHDGSPDMIVVDTDGDHGLDTVYADTNQDGQITDADDHQATGQDAIVSFTDHADTATPPEGHIADNDHPAGTDYNNDADVHEWA